MIYESQGIQSQGGLFEITSQEPIVSGEHRQGKRGSRRKARSKSQCDHCGGEFEVSRGTVGQFCSHVCMFEFRKKSVPSWANCYQCLALIGIGMAVASRLLKQDKATLHRTKKKMGFQTQLPECGEWRRYAQREQSKDCGWWGNADTAELWMREQRSKFPDWSCIWSKEKARKIMAEKYRSMDQDQKSIRNRKISDSRSQRIAKDPQLRKVIQQRIKEWKKRNPEKSKASTRKALAKMRQNPMFRIAFNMRSRFKEIMNGVRAKPTHGRWELIGCSQSDLKRHLERQFKNGMDWENYGSYWHVDHIIPCAAFDHSDPRQVSQCWHWTNLRPLEAAKNISKGAKITEPQMNLLLCISH